MILTPGPPDPVAFAPFGAFLAPPAVVGGRAPFGRWLVPVPGLAQRGHVNRVEPTELPVRLDEVERHPHAAQVFLPMGVSRYLVTVMPSGDTGAPDPAEARAFVVPGTTGVAYHPGTWHAGISVLDHEASFAVLMCRGRTDDDVFARIPPIEIHLPAPAAERRAHG